MARATWEAEFTEYFNARAHALRRLAYGLCGDWHTADDLVQAAFVRLYRSWPRIDPASVDPYARRVLVNQFLTQRRRRTRESITSDPPERAAPPGSDATDRLVLHNALAGLAPGQRAAVVLRYLEDLPVSEVAELLQVAEGTVKSQCARGLQSLRAALSPPRPIDRTRTDPTLTRE